MSEAIAELVEKQLAELHKIKQHTGVDFGSDEAIAEIVNDSTRNGFNLCREMADAENASIGDQFHLFETQAKESNARIESLIQENKALQSELARKDKQLEKAAKIHRAWLVINAPETLVPENYANFWMDVYQKDIEAIK